MRQTGYPRNSRGRKDRRADESPYKEAKASTYSDRAKIEEVDTVSDEERLGQIGRAMVEEAESGNQYQEFCLRAEEAYKYYFGDQWLLSDLSPAPAPSYRVRVTRNVTFHTVEAINGLLLDMRPAPYFTTDFPDYGLEDIRQARQLAEQMGALEQFPELIRPSYQNNEKLARYITDMYHAELDRRDEDTLLSKLFLDITIAGMGVRKLYWDRTDNMVKPTQLNPVDVLIDPYCRDRNREGAKYIIIRKEMDAMDVWRKYKVPKTKMERLLEQNKRLSDFDYDLYRPGVKYPIFRHDGYDKEIMRFSRDRICVYEIWFLGESLFEMEHSMQKELNYPNGRVFVISGDEVLFDTANPYEFVPLVFYQNYGDPRNPYGFGDPTTFRSEQVGLNIIMSQIVMNAVQMTNAQWLFEEGTVREDWLTNEPGLAISVPMGKMGAVHRLPAVPVDPSLFNVLGSLEQSVKAISNVNETVQGAMPSSHTSGSAIQQSQSAALLRTRQKAKRFESAYREEAYKFVRFVQNYYEFTDPILRGEMDRGEWLMWTDRLRELPLDVRIESRADQPASMMDRMRFAIEAVTTGLMDVVDALDYIGYPSSDRYKEKLRLAEQVQNAQMQITMAQLNQQMAQLQNPQQGPPPEEPAPEEPAPEEQPMEQSMPMEQGM